MTDPIFRDIEKLSAYLDGELPRVEMENVESRLKAEEDLAQALSDLRTARTILQRTPQRRAPRNFTLKPGMVRVRAPIPRAVPVFNWASAAAALFFIFTLGIKTIERVTGTSVGYMMAAAPAGRGGGAADVSSLPTEPAAAQESLSAPKVPSGTPTPEVMMAPAPTVGPLAETPMIGGGAPPGIPRPPFNWLLLWACLAGILLLIAGMIRWGNQQAFKRRTRKKT